MLSLFGDLARLCHVVGFIESIIRFALRLILFIIVLGQLGIDNTSFIAVGGAAIFALAFALQGALSNFAAGAMLIMFKYIELGDLVEVAGEFGNVAKLGTYSNLLLHLFIF
jgi:small conductance mechanosensitive channel